MGIGNLLKYFAMLNSLETPPSKPFLFSLVLLFFCFNFRKFDYTSKNVSSLFINRKAKVERTISIGHISRKCVNFYPIQRL